VAGEYAAQNGSIAFVSTVVVNWKGKRCTLNFSDYVEAIHGPILEGPTMPEVGGEADPPLKNPKVNAEGRAICDLPSTATRLP
jgi:hypothetical protein